MFNNIFLNVYIHSLFLTYYIRQLQLTSIVIIRMVMIINILFAFSSIVIIHFK